MKLTEVPQDADPSYGGKAKLCYAVDEDGKYVLAPSKGWHVEETVKGYAWEIIEKDLEQTRLLIQQGRESSLNYFMKFRLMDPKLLACNMGISTWRVKWHLRPRVFRKLSDEWLNRYAACLEIPADAIRGYDGKQAYK